MTRQLTVRKTSHEKWEDRGAGGVRETGEERAGRGTGKLSLFVTAYIQSKKRTQQSFLTSINVLRGLKQNFIREKSQKTKIRTRDKKQHYFRWNWETFPSRLHHRTWMRWHNTYTLVSTVSVVSVSRPSRFLSKFSARTTKRVRSNVVKDHFDRSQYFSVWW